MSAIVSSIHGLDYALSSWLTGLVIFYFAIVTAGGETAQRLLSDFPKRLRAVSLLTLATSSMFMLLSAQEMTESWLPSEIWRAMSMTTFGHLWCARLVVLALLSIIGPRLLNSLAGSVAIVLAAVIIPLLSVLSGHSGSQPDHLVVRVVTDWLHAAAVGVWSGGLSMLAVWLGKRLSEPHFQNGISFQVVTRFSHFAMASTAVITVTGVLTSYLNGVPLLTPWTSPYGQIIIVKVALFGIALLAAAINQFIHIRKWNRENEIACVTAIRREVRLEFYLLLIVFAAVGFLTRTALPGEVS